MNFLLSGFKHAVIILKDMLQDGIGHNRIDDVFFKIVHEHGFAVEIADGFFRLGQDFYHVDQKGYSAHVSHAERELPVFHIICFLFILPDQIMQFAELLYFFSVSVKEISGNLLYLIALRYQQHDILKKLIVPRNQSPEYIIRQLQEVTGEFGNISDRRKIFIEIIRVEFRQVNEQEELVMGGVI